VLSTGAGKKTFWRSFKEIKALRIVFRSAKNRGRRQITAV